MFDFVKLDFDTFLDDEVT